MQVLTEQKNKTKEVVYNDMILQRYDFTTRRGVLSLFRWLHRSLFRVLRLPFNLFCLPLNLFCLLPSSPIRLLLWSLSFKKPRRCRCWLSRTLRRKKRFTTRSVFGLLRGFLIRIRHPYPDLLWSHRLRFRSLSRPFFSIFSCFSPGYSLGLYTHQGSWDAPFTSLVLSGGLCKCAFYFLTIFGASSPGVGLIPHCTAVNFKLIVIVAMA